jgi:hypothetical protein
MFLMTNSLVQMFCNSTLQKWGGDLYITAMTVIMSVRELAFQVVHGVTNSAQPVIGYNYGAKEYGRVKQAILFTTGATVLYAGVLWAAIHMFPEAFIRIFNREPELLAVAVPAIRLYFFAFIFMALQSSGQSTAESAPTALLPAVPLPEQISSSQLAYVWLRTERNVSRETPWTFSREVPRAVSHEGNGRKATTTEIFGPSCTLPLRAAAVSGAQRSCMYQPS